jgi:uncharacterized protein (DUF2252 family)
MVLTLYVGCTLKRLMQKKRAAKHPTPSDRQQLLRAAQNLKMARGAHRFVRGSTQKFYEWLSGVDTCALPEGPPIWICGDCHLGNLGPVADTNGAVDIQIRDFDQTVIGNPVHDLIRLSLSMATAVRSSDLPGVITAKMMEALVDGYESAFAIGARKHAFKEKPEAVRIALKTAHRRTWQHLAKERIDGKTMRIPLGERFWPISKKERSHIEKLFQQTELQNLVTSLRHRDDGAKVKLLDASYWMKGCSSLGYLRFAVLLDIGGHASQGKDMCLFDIKEAVTTAAPRSAGVRMPRDNAQRVVEGARHLSPNLGNRIAALRLLDKSVFVRELLPQDMKLEIDHIGEIEVMRVAGYLAHVIGQAHARQMDRPTRKSWAQELARNRSKSLEVPSWLWRSVVDLVAIHEHGYLDHCRRYALSPLA